MNLMTTRSVHGREIHAATDSHGEASHVDLTAQDKKTLEAAASSWPTAWSTAADKRRDPHRRHPRPDALERPLQPDEAVHRDGHATPTAGSCSTCRRPRATCRRMLVASGGKQLIEQGKTTSIRGLYYLLKHTIEGTKEETFDDQAECDPMIEDVEVAAEQPPRGAAPVRPETRRHGRRHRARSTAATRSTARGWARAATAFRRSSSRT